MGGPDGKKPRVCFCRGLRSQRQKGKTQRRFTPRQPTYLRFFRIFLILSVQDIAKALGISPEYVEFKFFLATDASTRVSPPRTVRFKFHGFDASFSAN
eukprot:g2283.t1